MHTILDYFEAKRGGFQTGSLTNVQIKYVKSGKCSFDNLQTCESEIVVPAATIFMLWIPTAKTHFYRFLVKTYTDISKGLLLYFA